MPSRLVKYVLAIALAGIVPAFATTIYVAGDDSNLYTIDPTTGTTTLIGSMGVEMTDIAYFNGSMYGVSFPPTGDSSLYSIDPNTGAATPIGTDTGSFLNALQFGSDGTLYAAGGIPACGPPPQTSCDSFYTVNTTTGVASLVGSGSYNSSGDLEFIGSTLYLTSATSSTDQLYTIDPSTGAGSLVGDTTFAQVFGLAYVVEGNTLYGFNDVGNDVLAIDVTTGAATSVANYSGNFEILGAAINPVPEPRGTGIALGFAALLGLVFRHFRKRGLDTPPFAQAQLSFRKESFPTR